MQRVCLALPTMRPCPDTIAELAEEAAYAVANFDVEVHLLILDTTDAVEFAQNAGTVAALEPTPGVVVHHLSGAQQREFLRRVTERSGAADPELLLDMMLPRPSRTVPASTGSSWARPPWAAPRRTCATTTPTSRSSTGRRSSRSTTSCSRSADRPARRWPACPAPSSTRPTRTSR